MENKKVKNDLAQSELIKEYYIKHPNKNVKHPEIVDWAVKEWNKRTGGVFRDPDRAIRKLSQEGQLIKISKGVYRYQPDNIKHRKLEDFTLEQKEMIFKRDGYKCVKCGKERKDGVELQVDHIKAKDFGGKAEIENGQTLCAQCNFRKKNYNQTETGKKMFIRLYELATKINDDKIKKFCYDVLSMYEKHDINGHINWKK